MKTPIKSDSRYTITREFCGHETARHVVRFAGEWIGQSAFYASALMLAVGHKAKRDGALTVSEKTA